MEVKDMKERTIWSNMDLKLSDWSRDMNEEECPSCFDDEGNLDEDKAMQYIVELNAEYLEDERMNLNVRTDGKILVIADLGLWNGRKSGYHIFKNYNINEILYSEQCESAKWYSDGLDIRFTGHHHDGTNHYLYREIRAEKNIDVLLEKIYRGTAQRRDITDYTTSILPYVAEVYGW
jgi:hypothetical protein